MLGRVRDTRRVQQDGEADDWQLSAMKHGYMLLSDMIYSSIWF